MKSIREPVETDGLLNAVLADDDWRALNSSLKRDALAAVGAARRTRHWRRRLGQAACAAMVLVAASWWLRSAPPGHAPLTAMSAQPASPGAGDPFISEAEMLAMFPAGSCVVAEVNGRKELVFFDPKKAHEGFVVGR